MSEDLKELQRKIAKLMESVNRLAGDQKLILFGGFAQSYLASKLQNPTLRDSTKKSFENQIRNHLIPDFSLLPLDKITNEEWLKWVTEKKGITRFFNSRKVLIEILNAAKEQGILEKVPKLDNPDSKKNVGRALEEKEVLSLLWRSRKPFRFIFYVFWKMGCRPREILRWEWSMIRWNEPGKTWIDVPARITKTDRARSIPLNPDVSRLLFQRYMRGNGSEFVFPARGKVRSPQLSYQSAWDRACRRSGLRAVPYDLRRTFITRCAAEGQPLLFVAKILDTSVDLIESTYAKSQSDVMQKIIK